MTEEPNNTQLTTIEPKKPKRLNPKQKKTIEYYFDPQSETYSNLWRSAVKAGFRPKYALNIASNKPRWLYDIVESTLVMEQQHIINGVQQIATNPHVDSRSPADTNLKALELLGNWAGLGNSGSKVTVNVVQPILNGQSVASKKVTVEQSDSNNLTD